MKKLIRKSKRLQQNTANSMKNMNLISGSSSLSSSRIQPPTTKENTRPFFGLRRRSSSGTYQHHHHRHYSYSSSELMQFLISSNEDNDDLDNSHTIINTNLRHRLQQQNRNSSRPYETTTSTTMNNLLHEETSPVEQGSSEDILYINRNRNKSSSCTSSTNVSRQVDRRSSSSYCYFIFTIILILLVILIQITPSQQQQQYYASSDEWDTSSSSSHHFPSLLSSSSSSSLGTGGSSSSSNSGSSTNSGSLTMSSSSSSSYGHGYNCFNIPVNFTLCKNIGYTKMMVPNLLGHDSLQEAEYHAKAWVPLLGLQCHQDTQLFLCSLFTPICLDRPIYPCRSLCQGVQAKCEPRMLAYKYPWPSMLKCDQFPEDHDLCIRPGAANTEEKIEEPDCPSCHQAHTCENIVDNYCRANFVFRAKFKRAQGTTMEFRKGRWFKPAQEGQRRGRPEYRTFQLEPKDNCCNSQLTPGVPYIVMGVMKGDQRVITFVMPWNGKDKILKNAVRTFRSMDCSNPLPMSVMALGEEEPRNNKTTRRSAANNNSDRRRQRSRKDGQGQQQNHRKARQYGGCRVTPASEM